MNVPDILIVDDTPENLRVLGGMLREHGYKVRPAPSGRIALQAAASHPPDLILLDINMPEMDGYEVCGRLKEDPELQDIPVIFISALSETEDKLKAFRAGGYDYITKPFEFEEVEARVATQLRLCRLQVEVEGKNHELETNYRQLRELEKLRDNLIHMIVHDIRAPMSVVQGNIELMQMLMEGDEFAELVEPMGYAHMACKDSIGMVSNLLDISRMESGQMPVKAGEYELNEVVAYSRELMRVKADDKEITIAAEPCDFQVRCDLELLQRVVVNLLGNAIKFTPERGRIILATCETDGMAELSVQDTGPGIPEDFREKVFEKFGQVEAHQDRKVYSTGLGLTFCKLAVEAHDGMIGVDSVLGEGSRFWIRIPLA